ncbi:uncharacterized protein RCC_01783 [Ramularia collo-cygni]|uniref:Uncharacterized protein n=1 Tax=Ramularia collo-cygni TaxID=112498 RepID=A0A2D3V0F4_9PEZI|nr:uncharacterized protein RCC_01783 [Ramularia collo-cygni]CZT15944.1 uncharacterized protein RCC_01783 [Ramularia collo-cygni]
MATGSAADPQTLVLSALADKFLTRNDHLTFRSCAKLNASLDKVLPRPSGQSSSATFENADRPGTFQYMLSTHCSILACSVEVCAVVVSGAQLGPPDENADVVNIKDPRIVIAAASDQDDYKNPKIQEDGLEHKVTLSKFDVTGADAPPEDVVAALVKDLIADEGVKGAFQQGFNKHVRTYFQYLRAVHSASTKEMHTASVRRLRDYVYAKSYPKMLSRFAAGSKKGRDDRTANFWQVLMHELKDLPEHARSIAMPADLADKKPNAAQISLIKMAFARVDYVDFFTKCSVYRTHVDRLRFSQMLRGFLVRAKTGLDRLATSMEAVTSKSKPISEIISAVNYARDGMIVLLNFLDAFDVFLEPHLEWLAECANVTDFKEPPTWTVPTVAETPSQSQKKPEATGSEEYPDAETNEIEEEDDGTKEFYQAQDIVNGMSTSRQYQAWASACKNFLRLPCLHELSLRRATIAVPGRKTGSQKYESALVEQAEITVVNFEINAWDKEIAKIDKDFIAKLQKFEPDLDVKKLLGKDKKDLGYLGDPKIVGSGKLIQHSNPNIKGAPHCEMILMSLIAIANDKEIMSHIDDKWLKHNGIFATQEDLLDLPNVMNMVVVSKKNCPPCEKTRLQMSKSGIIHRDFIAPGFHNKWSGVMLPAIMPKKLGQSVVESTKRETAQKLLAFQKRVDDQAAKLKQKESPQSEEHDMSPDHFAVVENPDLEVEIDIGDFEACMEAENARQEPEPDTPDLSMAEEEGSQAPQSTLPHGMKRDERNFTTETQGDRKREKDD